MENASPTFSSVALAVVATLVDGVPFFSSAAASAMLKHDAYAAARSSSGFDPEPDSNRELKLKSPPRPFATLKLPRPPLSPPSHFAFAVRVGIVIVQCAGACDRDLTARTALT